MTKILAMMFAALPLTALAQVPDFTDANRGEGQRQIEEAGKLLADNLRSPTGVRFRNVFLFKTIGKDGHEYITVCGEVNAQNGYGGMTGFQNFTIIGKTLLTGSAGILNANMVCNGTTPRVRDSRDYTADLRKTFDANAGQ